MPIDVMKLADEAMTAHPDHAAALRETTWNMVEADLARFAALVLEEAANRCETLSFTEIGPSPVAKLQRNLCASAIRALKPCG